jgi:hypothetical protein
MMTRILLGWLIFHLVCFVAVLAAVPFSAEYRGKDF